MTAPEIMAALAAPFARDAVQWRIGSANREKTKAQAFAYVGKETVEQRLDDVLPGAWQCRYVWDPSGGKTVCEIGLYMPLEPPQWVWRADGSGDTDFEGAKGGLTGGFKRAAARWGVGRYLYDLPIPWVACKTVGTKGTVVLDATTAQVWAEVDRILKRAPTKAEPPPPKQSTATGPEDGALYMMTKAGANSGEYTVGEWMRRARGFCGNATAEQAAAFLEGNAVTMNVLRTDYPAMTFEFNGARQHFTEIIETMLKEKLA